jgi:hypothetical protein
MPNTTSTTGVTQNNISPISIHLKVFQTVLNIISNISNISPSIPQQQGLATLVNPDGTSDPADSVTDAASQALLMQQMLMMQAMMTAAGADGADAGGDEKKADGKSAADEAAEAAAAAAMLAAPSVQFETALGPTAEAPVGRIRKAGEIARGEWGGGVNKWGEKYSEKYPEKYQSRWASWEEAAEWNAGQKLPVGPQGPTGGPNGAPPPVPQSIAKPWDKDAPSDARRSDDRDSRRDDDRRRDDRDRRRSRSRGRRHEIGGEVDRRGGRDSRDDRDRRGGGSSSSSSSAAPAPGSTDPATAAAAAQMMAMMASGEINVIIFKYYLAENIDKLFIGESNIGETTMRTELQWLDSHALSYYSHSNVNMLSRNVINSYYLPKNIKTTSLQKTNFPFF